MNLSSYIRLMALLLTGLWVWLALPANADAAVLSAGGIRCLTTNGAGPPGSVITQADAAVAGMVNNTFTLKILYCFRSTIQDVTYVLLSGITNSLRPTFYIAMSLMFTLLGVRIMTGKYQAISVDSFVFLSKICIAMFLFEKMIDYYPIIYSAIDDLTNMVTSGFRGTTAIGGPACTEPANLPAAYAVWFRGDCIIKRLFYWSAGGIGIGIAGIIIASLFTGGWGIGVCVMGISAILAFLMMLVRCIYHVFSAYLLIAFMVVVGPLLIPFIFIEVKKNIFRKWGDNIIAGVIQPVMIIAFLMFMLKVLNFFTFDTTPQDASGGPRTVQSIASLIPSPSTCQIVERQLFTGGAATDPQAQNQSFGTVTNTGSSTQGFFKSIGGKLIMWASNTIDVGKWFKVPALSCMSMDGSGVVDVGLSLLGKLFLTLFAILIVAIVTMKFANEIPELAKSLSGSQGLPLEDLMKSSDFGKGMDKAHGAAEQLLAAAKSK